MGPENDWREMLHNTKPGEEVLVPSGDMNEASAREDIALRTFPGGATRDTVRGKLSYVKALSPIVLRGYVQYLDQHRTLPDGSRREFNNWKAGIPLDTYLDSKGRHDMAVWLLMQGFTEVDNHGPVTLVDSLYGVLFNTMGMIHEILQSAEDK